MQANPVFAVRRTFIEHRPLIMSVAVLGWSIKYTISLAMTHSAGPELYGVLTAALAAGAGVANLVLLRTSRTQSLVTVAVLVLWAVIAIAGVAGTIAHVVGPVPGYGPMDLRPRPLIAPLVFTLLGFVGGTALFLGRRSAIRRVRKPEEE